MRGLASRLSLLVLAMAVFGCTGLFEHPDLRVESPMNNTPVTPLAAPLSPEPPRQQHARSPLRLPTLTPPATDPSMITPVPLALVEATQAPSPPPTALTAVPGTLLTCTREGEWIACHDQLLVMDFRYPAFMGELAYTRLRRGGYAGFSYDYLFVDRGYAAGGRSRDFSEGRERFLTDRMGFAETSADELCAQWPPSLCQQLSPGVLAITLLPQPEQLCNQAPTYIQVPAGFLVLDLPEHPLIHGFAFLFPLLPADSEAAFRDQWYSHDWRQVETQCKPLKGKFQRYIEKLREDLPAGVAPAEIQQRYDALFELAKSIKSPYVNVIPLDQKTHPSAS